MGYDFGMSQWVLKVGYICQLRLKVGNIGQQVKGGLAYVNLWVKHSYVSNRWVSICHGCV